MLKLTTDKHEAFRGLSATAELLVLLVLLFRLQIYHCVQLNYFLFSSLRRIGPCCRPPQIFAGASPTVRSRPTLHCPRQLFLSLRSSHVQQLIDSQWQMADCVVVGKCFWQYARPSIFDSHLLHQNRDLCLYPSAFDAPVGGSRRNIVASFGMEKLEWRGYPRVKKISKIRLFVLT